MTLLSNFNRFPINVTALLAVINQLGRIFCHPVGAKASVFIGNIFTVGYEHTQNKTNEALLRYFAFDRMPGDCESECNG